MRQSSGEQGELLAEHKEDEKDSGRIQLGESRVYSGRQLNSDSHLVCFIVQLLE